MARHKIDWDVEVFSVGSGLVRDTSVAAYEVQLRLEIADGREQGRMLDLSWTPEQAREYAQQILRAADNAESGNKKL